MSFTKLESSALLNLAREAIRSNLFHDEPRWPALPQCAALPGMVFVTIKKSGQLRGCIGNLSLRSTLSESIKEMAVAAALNDPRFPPLNRSEYAAIRLELTILGNPWIIKDINEIKIGEHGVILTCNSKSAVFLPQVAVEQHWNRETLLDQLALKAKLSSDIWRSGKAQLEIFTACVLEETHNEDPHS